MNPLLTQAAAYFGIFTNKFAANDPTDKFSPEQLDHLKKVEAARLASRHSTGPTTPEGKHISAQNARKHGYSGATMVIDEEDRPAYDAHLEGYIQAFQPQNQPQNDAVRLVANAMWRTDRLSTIETSLLDLEIGWNSPFTDIHVTGLHARHHIAIGFLQHTQSSNALDLCRRYLSSAQRDYHRAISTFEKLKEITTAVSLPEPETVRQPDPEPAETLPKLHLVQRDPNEPATVEPSDSSKTSYKTNSNSEPHQGKGKRLPKQAI